MIINLNTKDKIMGFVNFTKRFDSPIDMKKGSHCVDAKSIMGVIALGVYEPVEVYIITSDEDEMVRFNKECRQFV